MGLFGKNKAEGLHDDWFGEAAALPRGDEPIEVKNRRGKWLRRAIIASSLTGLLSMPLWVLAVTMQVEPEPPIEPQLYSVGKAEAMATVEEWLDQTPSPVPEGRLQSWDSFTVTPFPEPDPEELERGTASVPDHHLEVHSLTVLDNLDRYYTAEVQIAVSDTGSVHHIANPSLIPYTPSGSQFSAGELWPGFSTGGTVPAPVETAVNTWLQAFTSGSPDDLRQAIADPETDRSYVPLVGVSAAAGQITDSAYYMVEDDEGKTVEDDRMIVRIAATLTWDGQVSATNENTEAPAITYDLLVHEVDTASPRVVAWGGPGTGHMLKPYENALEGVEDISGDLAANSRDRDQEAETGTPTDQPVADETQED